MYKQTNAEGALLSAKEVTFSDEDPVWRQVRSVDAANAIELLRTGLRVIVRKRREAELKKKTSVRASTSVLGRGVASEGQGTGTSVARILVAGCVLGLCERISIKAWSSQHDM